jgi:hypothetical protein
MLTFFINVSRSPPHEPHLLGNEYTSSFANCPSPLSTHSASAVVRSPSTTSAPSLAPGPEAAIMPSASSCSRERTYCLSVHLGSDMDPRNWRNEFPAGSSMLMVNGMNGFSSSAAAGAVGL